MSGLPETTLPVTSAIVSDAVRMRFGFGSDLVRTWFGCGSDVGRRWLERDSDLVQTAWQKLRESGFQQSGWYFCSIWGLGGFLFCS